jgi:hypothetical protein
MFNFANKRSDQIKVIDKIAVSQYAKWENCLREWKQNKSIVFIAWFDETLEIFKNYTASNTDPQPEIYLANEMQSLHVQNENTFIFLEHFPLRNKEQALFKKLHITEAIVYSSLNEPLLMHTGSENINRLMQTLGMKETEILQHTLISNSIKQIQKKLEEKITVEQSAPSQQQWMNANVQAKIDTN